MECPHHTIECALTFPKMPDWASFPSRSFTIEYSMPLTRVQCLDCEKEIAVDNMLSEQGLQAIADAFGERWKNWLIEEWQKESAAFAEWYKTVHEKQPAAEPPKGSER